MCSRNQQRNMNALYSVVSHILQMTVDNITSEKWKSIHDKFLQWRALDKFQNVYDTVDWDKGIKGHHMHEACYASLSTKRELSQAEKCKTTSEESAEVGDETSDEEATSFETSARKCWALVQVYFMIRLHVCGVGKGYIRVVMVTKKVYFYRQ